MNRVGKWTLFFILLCIAPVVAAQLDCPTIVQAALDATDEQCSGTERNEACYGNVNLQAIPQSDVSDFTFGTPGDIVGVSTIESLTLSSRVEEDGEWGVALMQIQANIPDTLPGQNVTFLLFGDVQITNAVESNSQPVTFEVAAEGDINVRSGPSADDAQVGSLSDGDSLTAIGRNADGTWLQVSLPDDSVGWVSAELVTTEGDITTLNIINPEAEPLNPMQAFYFQSGIGDAPCAEAPDSGILVQTPEGVGEIQLTINEVSITLGSTAYLQAQPGGDMTASVIEGQATVTARGWTVVAPAGSQVRVPLDDAGRAISAPNQADPYDGASLAVLPIGNMPRAITIADPIAAADSAANIIPAAGQWQIAWDHPSQTCEVTVNGEFYRSDTAYSPQFDSFDLPDGEFTPVVLLGAIIHGVESEEDSNFSSPESNLYVEGQFGYMFDVRFIDSEHMEGHLVYMWENDLGTPRECVLPFSFTATRVGDVQAPPAGIAPAAGEWQATWDPPSISCEIESTDLSGTLTWDMTYYESFRLSDAEFSPAILYGAVFNYDMSRVTPDISTIEPATYVMFFTDTIGDVYFEVTVLDSDHMSGFYELTNANCLFSYTFVMTRVGD